MIAIVGLVSIMVALGGSVVLAINGFRVARSPDRGVASLRVPVLLVLVGGVAAFAALETAILTHDFSIDYVASHTSRSTPVLFLLASGWAALEGSIVLWGLVLAGFTAWVARSVTDGDGLGAGALAVLGGIGVFWFGLMATAGNPFAICTEAARIGCVASQWLPFGSSVAPIDGPGPNPLLQNHILMAVHPPLLYVGYVGFSVPFAFAISAMARGERGTVWLERTHRWSIVTWSFLSIGLVLGAWWSYEVLGWGGYWAWDPVENVALLPWLVGTAFIHSAIVQRRRGMLQAWNLVLVISVFSLTIFGTFLTRSGTVASVHAFSLSAVGPALLAFLGIVILGSFGLFAMRSHLVASSPRLDSLSSREGMFLFNNLLLTVLAVTVLIGTLWPLIVEATSGDLVSVGRPFFDRVTLPIAFALLLAMGIGPVTPYRVARFSVVWQWIARPLQVSLGVGVLVVVLGVESVPTVVVVVLSSFVISVIVRLFAHQVARRVRSGEQLGMAVRKIVTGDAGYWGGQIAHVGFALLALGIAASTALAVRDHVMLRVGETAVVNDYCFGFLGPFSASEPNRFVKGAEIVLMEPDCRTEIARMFPRVHHYPDFPQGVIATPDVHWGFREDVYLSLVNVTADDTLFLDVFIFPLMWLIWSGGALVFAGGIYSFLARSHSSQRVAPPVSLWRDQAGQ